MTAGDTDLASVSPQRMFAWGREVLAAQPFSVLLGAELHVFEPGRAELQLPVTDKLKQQYGFVHGGVLSYLADNALTYAGGSSLGMAVITAEFKVNYVRPGIGQRLIARARTLHAGRTQAVCACEVFAVQDDGSEKLCAVAQGTINKLPETPKSPSSPESPGPQP